MINQPNHQAGAAKMDLLEAQKYAKKKEWIIGKSVSGRGLFRGVNIDGKFEFLKEGPGRAGPKLVTWSE